jgi:hypothetical protein
MLALANRPMPPAPETPAPRPAGRVREETTGSRPAPDAGERPTFLLALLRALGAIHT